MIDNEAEWIKRLTFAALPNAARVWFSYEKSSDGQSVHYALKSFDDAGKPIGDDRDYDLLKAVMTPLERLVDDEMSSFIVELEIKTGNLKEV